MNQGRWITATVAITETVSGEVDLGEVFRKVLVLVPTLDNATVTVHVAKESGGTFFPIYALDDDATGDFPHATTALTTAKAVIFECGAQHIKIVCGAAQNGGARTFYARGLN